MHTFPGHIPILGASVPYLQPNNRLSPGKRQIGYGQAQRPKPFWGGGGQLAWGGGGRLPGPSYQAPSYQAPFHSLLPTSKLEQLTQGASKRCQVQRKGTMPVLSMVVPPVLSALTHERRSCSLKNSLTSCKSVLKCGLLTEATLITISSCNLPPTPNPYFVLILCNSNHLLTLLLLMLVSCYSRSHPSEPESCDGRDLCHRGTSRYSLHDQVNSQD